MRILLDTHALLGWLLADPRLGRAAQELVADPANDGLVSVASLWEIQGKVRVGKLKADLAAILAEIQDQGFALIDVTPAHFLALGPLPRHHDDPWDHLLIAQAQGGRGRLPVRGPACPGVSGERHHLFGGGAAEDGWSGLADRIGAGRHVREPI